VLNFKGQLNERKRLGTVDGLPSWRAAHPLYSLYAFGETYSPVYWAPLLGTAIEWQPLTPLQPIMEETTGKDPMLDECRKTLDALTRTDTDVERDVERLLQLLSRFLLQVRYEEQRGGTPQSTVLALGLSLGDAADLLHNIPAELSQTFFAGGNMRTGSAAVWHHLEERANLCGPEHVAAVRRWRERGVYP